MLNLRQDGNSEKVIKNNEDEDKGPDHLVYGPVISDNRRLNYPIINEIGHN